MVDTVDLAFANMPDYTPRASIVRPLPSHCSGAQSSKSFGAFTVRAISGIRAPADMVVHAIVETGTWPLWNGFHPSADVKDSTIFVEDTALIPGSFFTAHVDMSGKGKAKRAQKMRMISKETIKPTEENANKGKGVRIVWIGKQYRPKVL